jgi:hypothetical protein
MRRLFLIIVVASSSLHATSVTFASCSLGSKTIVSRSSCLIPFGVSDFIAADASVSGSGTDDIVAVADAGATADPGVAWSASSRASDTEVFGTAGPLRPGLIGLVIEGFGGLADASLTQGRTTYGIGTDNCCFPFELGALFQVSVSAGADAAGGLPNAQSSSASLSFLLLEADGSPVSFFSVATPEPATWGLLLLGLSACATLSARARRAG